MVKLRLPIWSTILLALAGIARAQNQEDYYRLLTYEVPPGLALEASGLALLPDGRLAVGVRRGEVWLLDHPLAEPPTGARVGFHLFASGMHELLGLAWHDGALYATQRTEVTRLEDTDGDGVADAYLTAASGWGVSGNYHEYAYGPVFDSAGNAFTTLNSSLGPGWPGAGEVAKHPKWRGWCVMTPPGGVTQPWAAGFRSPCGIGTNDAGDLFVTDQQGNWFGTNPLLHVRRGAFFGHAGSIPDTSRPESPVKNPGALPQGITVAEAVHRVPGYTLPAVWFPYMKMGQSPTGLHCDRSGGRFGPFASELFIGEFVHSGVNRVFLEKVEGEYQGACFPFVKGLQCAALSVNALSDGSLVVGESNRGWNSYGNRSFGLQRLVWTGRTPLEATKMEAQPDGFRFTFSLPLEKGAPPAAESFHGQSYTYLYHEAYGSPEVETEPLAFRDATISEDRRSITVKCTPLRPGFVCEVELPALQAANGELLWHRMAYYTLNHCPAARPIPAQP